MAQRIIYRQDDGRTAVIAPSAEALAVMTITQIANKDVPTGKPYKIIDDSELPADRLFRNAWESDDVDLTDGVGS